MNGYLRQSTAAQVRTIGPFVDDTDFKTLENGLTINNTDVLLKKNGGASAAKNSGGATADGAGGLYHLTWDATDTATVGELSFSVKVAGALVVFGTYVVLEEAVYDALFAAAAAGYGTAQTGDSFARLGAPAGASVSADILAVKTETASIQTDTNDIQTTLAAGVSVATGGIAAASFAAGAIDAAAIAANAIGASEIADGAIDAGALAADCITAAKIATGAIDADALAADAVDELWDEQVGDGTITARQALRVLIATLAGKLSGAATTTVTIRNSADTADVVVATVDADGNRTAVTLTP